MKNHYHVKWEAKGDPYKLNLDEGFDPLSSLIKKLDYKMFNFKGGEPHFQITTNVEYFGDLFITQRYNSPSDVFNILLANDAARRIGFENIHLVLPYFPAARQDRICNEGEPLTIKVFTDLINSCNFKSVHILSPHSEVTPALLNNVIVHDELDYVASSVIESIADMVETFIKHYNIVCPDAGAGKRVQKVIQHLTKTFPDVNFNLIRCEKVRDVKDGSLKEFFVQADNLEKHPTLIVDDINSMGGTFIGLGNVLRQKNCGKLMLFTSHADCVQGIQNIIETFDHYYTTNSKKNWGDFKYTFDNRFTCFDFKI